MPSTVQFKRLNSEIRYINENLFIENKKHKNTLKFNDFVKSLTYILHSEDFTNHPNYLNIYLKDDLLLSFNITNNYPFQPLKICKYNLLDPNYDYKKNILNYNKLINNISNTFHILDKNIFIFFYRILYQTNPMFLNLKKESCFCCSSILCHGNWCVQYKLTDILLEYNEILFINKYINKLNYKKIYNIYHSMFNTYFNKLPPEINEIIFNYIV